MRRVWLAAVGATAAYALVLVGLSSLGAGQVKRHNIEAAAMIFAAACLASLWTMPRSERSDPLPPRAGTWRRYASVVALVGCASLYGALRVGFLSDDYVLRQWALSGQFLGDGSQFARPVVLWLWRAVLMVGAGAVTLHAVSLALHGLNIYLVTSLASRLGLGLAGSMVSGATFALLPTQVEPVFWAACQFDLLMTTCILSLLVIDVNAGTGKWRVLKAAGGICLGLLALWSKETAVVLPALWIVARYPAWRRSGFGRTERAVTLGLAAATLAYLAWRWSVHLPLAGSGHVSRYLLKEQLSRTVAGLVVPYASSTLGRHGWILLVASATAVAAAVALVAPRAWAAGQRVSIQGLAWCALASVPTLGFLFIGAELDGSRYLYLPAVGWGLFVGAACQEAARSGLRFVLAPLLVVSAFLAVGQRHLSASQWLGAASERDRLLREAVTIASERQCSSAEFRGLPPRFGGAQLFTNGFAEAFELTWSKSGDGAACHFEWTPQGRFEQTK